MSRATVYLVAVLLLALCLPSVSSAGWQRRYTGGANIDAYPASVGTDAAGNVYVAGWRTAGTVLIKYDNNGNFQWLKLQKEVFGLPVIAVDKAGNTYLVGGSGTIVTMKYDTNGVRKWIKTFSGVGNAYLGGIASDDAGNVCVTGVTPGGSGVPIMDIVTIMYDGSGVLKWSARYPAPAGWSNISSGVGLDSEGNAYVAGDACPAGAGADIHGADGAFLLLKYNPAGKQQWVKRWGHAASAHWQYGFPSLAVDGSGNAHVTGTAAGPGGSFDYSTTKYDTNGNLVWRRFFNGGNNAYDSPHSITVDGNGNLYVAGVSNGSTSGIITVKYDPNGVFEWAGTYQGRCYLTSGPSIAVDGTGNVYVSTSHDITDYWGNVATIKYKPDGGCEWVKTFGHPDRTELANGIALDGTGNVFVIADSAGLGGTRDIVTLKYDQ